MRNSELSPECKVIGDNLIFAMSQGNNGDERLVSCCKVFGYECRLYLNASKLPHDQGVYVFIDGAIVRYVGKSRDVHKRCQQREYEYDCIGFVPIDSDNIDVCEIRLISLLCPQYNSQTRRIWEQE